MCNCDFTQQPDFYYSCVRKARKSHICCECNREIKKGETYNYLSGKWDDTIQNYKTCKECAEVGEILECYGLGEMYQELWDCPQTFVVPAFIGSWNHIIVKDGVRYKQVYSSPKWENSVMYVRTDVYPLLWAFYAFVVFLDKFNLKLKKVVYEFLLRTKQGKDFLPVGERVSGWREFFKFYLSSLGEK